MSDLTNMEKRNFEKLFGMSSGYVLDYSNRTFDEFVIDSTGLSIMEEKYNQASGSKAHRLRAFWSVEPNHVVAKLLQDLLQCVSLDGIAPKIQKAYDDCSQAVARLSGGKDLQTIKNPFTPNTFQREDTQMFYHVIVETTEKVGKTGKNKEIYEFNKTDRALIENEIVLPYVQKATMQIDGYFLQPNEIKRIAIKQTEKTTDELVSLAYNNLPDGVITIIGPQDVIENDKYSADITKEIFKYAQSQKSSLPIQSLPVAHDKEKIFIVHGHDDAARLAVARFIEQIGFEPIILHEQASSGKTIIEKIESYTNVGFGVVLYTPCDVGGKKVANPELKDRARQNVVFEHGYLIAKLGRHKVCALVKGEIETPNDISGVVYVPLDEHEAWKMKLAKELKTAGYVVDMNKAV